MVAVLVTGLLMGLVGMHHLSVTPGTAVAFEAPAAVPVSSHLSDPGPPSHQPGSPHDGGEHDSGLLHLCLAILAAVAVLTAASGVLWRSARPITTTRHVGRSGPWTAPRAPPPTAPARLALLCVLRT